MKTRVSFPFVFSLFVVLIARSCFAEESKEFVLTLDHSNFTDIVSKHDLIVVEFYAPWCGHCKKLAPEYEKAASVLSSHDPPVILAKLDASEEVNKELASKFSIRGFPTIKILRNGGKDVQDYNGPREADGIVSYLKKQSGPASAEIKSAEDASNLIDDKSIVIVGVFPKFAGEEYENFISLAKKLRADYDLGHTLDAKFLPRGDSSATGPLVRLFKPFDDLFADFEDFNVDAMEKFVEKSSVPLVTIFNNDKSNQPFVAKFFENSHAKAMLFVNFKDELADSFKSVLHDVAKKYKNEGISFLIGDLDVSEGALKFFGLKREQAPLLIVQSTDEQKYLKSNTKPEDIESWVKDYKEGKVSAFKKSQPIPETNDEPVKVVVAGSLQDIVFNSGKNVLLEFYAPWCGHCKTLAPILTEVAISYESDADIIIAKYDATENDVPKSTFNVRGFPTVYFKSASGKLLQYDGSRSKDDIIDFIEKNRDQAAEQESIKDVEEDSVKDEL